jgi:hypothetical protein
VSQLLDDFANAISRGLVSDTLNSCYRWATKRRIMGEPFPGPYSDKYHPWVREMHDSQAPFNYAMKGAQLGVTEVGINRAFYVLDRLRRDVLYVLPTALNASDFSKSRFGPALSHSPYLEALFSDTDAVNIKRTPTNTLYVRGSRGDSNLKSIPVSELILDELDEMNQKQIELAIRRLDGQRIKHVWGISTPTIHGHGIHKYYQGTTQEHFHFKCPCCSRWTELLWPDCIEIIGEHVADVRCKDSFLKCKECKGRLEHQDKPSFLRAGKWIATNQQASADYRGFHISQLYSFTVSPAELVQYYMRGTGDEFAMKEFHNSSLGQPFINDGAKVSDDDIDHCIGGHSKEDARPESGGSRIITMGVDQGKWSYVSINEWFFPSWTIDINAASHGRVLWEGKFYEDEWDTRLNELMREWQVLACVIDADPQINEARRFARRFPGYVWLCRYRAGQSAKEISLTNEDDGAPMATVDRTNWLSASLGRFRQPRRIELPKDVSHEYREHIKSPVRTYKKDDEGNVYATFESVGADHFAHAQNYAEIALPLVAARETHRDIKSFNL